MALVLLKVAVVDGLLLLSLALLAGQLATVAPWEIALGGGAVVLAAVLRRPGRWPLVIALAGAAALGLVRARASIDRYDREVRRVQASSPTGLIETSGVAVVSAPPSEVHGTMRFMARFRADRDGPSASLSVWENVLLYGGPADVAQGDRFELTARLAPPERFANEALGDPRPGAARRDVARSGGIVSAYRVARGEGLLAAIDRARSLVRARIEATFSSDVAPMARALVLGESDLAPEDDLAFRGSGLSHLLAVSGMHLVLVVAGALALVRMIGARVSFLAERLDVGRYVAAVGPPLAWSYAVFAGSSGSAFRAAWMLSFVCTARAFGRHSDGVRALALSIVAMALIDPLVAFDVSFALSAGATWGLFVIGRPLADWSSSRVPDRLAFVVRPAAATIAATIPCAPMIARFAPTLPLGGVVANLLAVPVGEAAALPLCLAHVLLSKWTLAEAGCAVTAGGALRLLRGLAAFFAGHGVVPVPLPTGAQLAVLATLACLLSDGPRARSTKVLMVAVAAFLLVGLESHARAEGCPREELRVTFLDVGQGDSALIDLPDGRAMLIDGGGLVGSPVDVGARVLLPLLRARRRSRIDVVVLTHPHPDHFLGLASLLGSLGSEIAIGELWDTGQGERENVAGPYASLLRDARARNVPVRRPRDLCGVQRIGQVEIHVLSPCPDVDGDRDPNNNSFVLHVAFGARSFLFAGDAERPLEADLLRPSAAPFLAADVLKVGHHGSRTSSSPEFLAAVRPSFVVISSGVRNRFNHPHPTTLATLARLDLPPLRTDRLGSITMSTDGRALSLDSFGRAP